MYIESERSGSRTVGARGCLGISVKAPLFVCTLVLLERIVFGVDQQYLELEHIINLSWSSQILRSDQASENLLLLQISRSARSSVFRHQVAKFDFLDRLQINKQQIEFLCKKSVGWHLETVSFSCSPPSPKIDGMHLPPVFFCSTVVGLHTCWPFIGRNGFVRKFCKATRNLIRLHFSVDSNSACHSFWHTLLPNISLFCSAAKWKTRPKKVSESWQCCRSQILMCP